MRLYFLTGARAGFLVTPKDPANGNLGPTDPSSGSRDPELGSVGPRFPFAGSFGVTRKPALAPVRKYRRIFFLIVAQDNYPTRSSGVM